MACPTDHAAVEETMRKLAQLLAELTEKNNRYASAYTRADELLAVSKATRKEYDDYCQEVVYPLNREITELRAVIQDNQGRLLTQLLGTFDLPTIN